MPLVAMRELLRAAKGIHSTVAAFNVANLEMVQGVVGAAEAHGQSLVMQIAQCRLDTAPLPLIGRAMVAAAQEAGVPVAVHFDHGLTLDAIHQALDLGFTSVMYDGSTLPLEENIERTLEVTALASRYGAGVEGEVGRVGRGEDGGEARMAYSDPEDALRYARATGVDALAVAIGNAHGIYEGAPELHYEILTAITAQNDTPLVLHGGTGISADNFRRLIRSGMRKINIGTAGFQAAARAARTTEGDDIFEVSRRQIAAAARVVTEHLRIFGIICEGER